MGILNKKNTGKFILKRTNWLINLFNNKSVVDTNYQQIPSSIIQKFNRTRFLGPQKHLCYAPFKMMYFAFNGEVIACCHNRKNIMGRYPEQSINDIWNGSEFNKLRNFIEHDDLSYGCDVCKYALLSENFDGAKNGLYDRYKVRSYPQVMEFELDNRCNLECVICNDLFSSSIGNDSKLAKKSPYNDAFVEQLKPFLSHLKETKFYGGEPFLIPIYYQIWELLLEKNPRAKIMIQTNGTVLNDKIKSLLEKGNFHINVSIDSFDKQTFEEIRKKASFEKTMENLAYFENYCKKKKTHLGIIPTPHRNNVFHIAEIVRQANQRNAKVYFNTLISPYELALWNLASDELEKIIKILSKETFPKKMQIEKENAHHFQDFLKQLEAWRKNNNAENEVSGKIKMTNDEIEQTRLEFLEKLSEALADDTHQLLTTFNNVMKEFPENDAKKLFFARMKSIPLDDVIMELQKNDPIHLKKIIGKKIYEAGNEFEIKEA